MLIGHPVPHAPGLRGKSILLCLTHIRLTNYNAHNAMNCQHSFCYKCEMLFLIQCSFTSVNTSPVYTDIIWAPPDLKGLFSLHFNTIVSDIKRHNDHDDKKFSAKPFNNNSLVVA